MTRLWLDDVRDPPDDTWTVARTAQEAMDILSNNLVEEASLDHDLGDGPSGSSLVYWMVENEKYPTHVTIHSMNPVGAIRMKEMLEKHGPYKTVEWIPFESHRRKS